jgi:hypothetical protein
VERKVESSRFRVNQQLISRNEGISMTNTTAQTQLCTMPNDCPAICEFFSDNPIYYTPIGSNEIFECTNQSGVCCFKKLAIIKIEFEENENATKKV